MPTMGNAKQRHLYAGGDPDAIAKALRIEWERGENDAEGHADHGERLELMIANAIHVAVKEGICYD